MKTETIEVEETAPAGLGSGMPEGSKKQEETKKSESKEGIVGEPEVKQEKKTATKSDIDDIPVKPPPTTTITSDEVSFVYFFAGVDLYLGFHFHAVRP